MHFGLYKAYAYNLINTFLIYSGKIQVMKVLEKKYAHVKGVGVSKWNPFNEFWSLQLTEHVSHLQWEDSSDESLACPFKCLPEVSFTRLSRSINSCLKSSKLSISVVEEASGRVRGDATPSSWKMI